MDNSLEISFELSCDAHHSPCFFHPNQKPRRGQSRFQTLGATRICDDWLVVYLPSEKYEFVSWDDYSQ